MTRLTLLVLAIAWTLGGCLPNPQSEWTSSEGGSQRSTLDDPSITAHCTPAPPGGGILDFDWGYAFSFSSPDDDRSAGASPAREHAHPTVTVDHRFTVTEHRISSGGGGGGGGGGRRR